jgi:bifunctional NMN adenylyltransferase/nudix hydrolase
MQLGVIIGRFQVPELHDGHMKLIEHIKQQHGQLLILLGVSPILGSKRNPLDFPTRQKMIQDKFPDVTVVPISDMPSDAAWCENIDKIIRSVNLLADVTLYGGKDSFIPFYKGKFKTVEIELELSPSGTDIRAIAANRVKISADFRAGVIYGAWNQYDRVFPTVDVAILREDREGREGKGPKEGGCRYQVLLGRKLNMEGLWLPGGFVSPADPDYETAARREAMEETGIKCPTLDYVCSHRNTDWRYKHREDGTITTVLFVCLDSIGTPRAGDDLERVAFFPLDGEKTLQSVGASHRPLIENLFNGYGYVPGTPRKGWKDHDV